jgi:hypothetical protein
MCTVYAWRAYVYMICSISPNPSNGEEEAWKYLVVDWGRWPRSEYGREESLASVRITTGLPTRIRPADWAPLARRRREDVGRARGWLGLCPAPAWFSNASHVTLVLWHVGPGGAGPTCQRPKVTQTYVRESPGSSLGWGKGMKHLYFISFLSRMKENEKVLKESSYKMWAIIKSHKGKVHTKYEQSSRITK